MIWVEDVNWTQNDFEWNGIMIDYIRYLIFEEKMSWCYWQQNYLRKKNYTPDLLYHGI